MPEWFRPVVQVGNVVVIGENHRERTSRNLMKRVWDEYNFDAICTEVAPDDVAGWRDDRGGAIGLSLGRAGQADIPRFYVDEDSDDIVEAFGSRLSAYRYLRGLRDRVPKHDDGLMDRETISEIRTEVKSEYGEDAHRLVFTKREKRMAARAKWVAREEVEGTVALIVGGGHVEAIVEHLEDDIEPLEMSNKRVRHGERVQGGPWTVMLTISFKETSKLLREAYSKVDWNDVRSRIVPWRAAEKAD